MFNTPIAGLSLLTNLLIIIVSAFLNLIRGRKITRTVVSQKHILKLESTKIGKILTPIIAISMPIVILIAATAVSSFTLYSLYHDSRKVSVVNLAEDGAVYSIEGYKSAKKQISVIANSSNNLLELKNTAQSTFDTISSFQNAKSKISGFIGKLQLKSDVVQKNQGTQELFISPVSGVQSQVAGNITVADFPKTFQVEKAVTSFFTQEAYNEPKIGQAKVMGVFTSNNQILFGNSWISNITK